MKNTRNPTKEEIKVAVERAHAFYHDDIKHQLTDADKGRYIAIDGNTGEWEIGDTDDVVDRLKARVPNALVHTITHITMVAAYFHAVPEELARELRKPVPLSSFPPDHPYRLEARRLADEREEFGR